MADSVTDAEYLKSPELGGVIAKGMAVMYKTNPKNPVDFLAKWLMNYAQVERAAENRAEQLAIVEQQMKQHSNKRSMLNTEQAGRKKMEDDIRNEKEAFLKKISSAHDLSDHLQDLVDHLKKYSNASAVYIGKLVSRKKPIKENDNDEAHIDDKGEKIIHFSHADGEH